MFALPHLKIFDMTDVILMLSTHCTVTHYIEISFTSKWQYQCQPQCQMIKEKTLNIVIHCTLKSHSIPGMWSDKFITMAHHQVVNGTLALVLLSHEHE